ncbi:anthranilate synthase component 1 [Reichenbachiella agariperforans]|uniref:Anthranilate synthase component 1 n=1 Tax=Reichenbachiella agariperforans TaxID=156994 RepID=A0A1M6VPY5_REIAG|nr:anthranilate synthase component I family protein [Reichenbachiella agariperforans]SHK83306.1 anthranilate synthase component 1 [Reichenbachiella agariperforans]
MKEVKIYSKTKEILGDLITPVSIYLRVREKYPNSFLLESSDYHAKEGSISYIGFQPVAEFRVEEDRLFKRFPEEEETSEALAGVDLREQFVSFSECFKPQDDKQYYTKSGLFGFTSYEAVQYFEDITFNPSKPKNFEIPLMQYFCFKYVIAFDHFRNKIFITENSGDPVESYQGIENVEDLIFSSKTPQFDFSSDGEIESDMTDGEFRENVLKAIKHSQLGDTFQMVLSRSFKTSYEGDDFFLYRALRSVNPSPYLFYFDYGKFRIFGSSPEAQLEVNDGKAAIFPIAGTYRRTGSDEEDTKAAKALSEDEKETAEHVMLVDLARNDLSISGDQVTVEKFKEIQFFSHVIHLVSKVTTILRGGKSAIDLAADTFPAGTLSGAPKYKAMGLIDQYDATVRGYYGGMIGLMDFYGNFNHAILIRSFLSQDNQLHFRAGAGVVAKSDPDSEVQEVYNKIGALKTAIEKANSLNQAQRKAK